MIIKTKLEKNESYKDTVKHCSEFKTTKSLPNHVIAMIQDLKDTGFN